MWSEGPSRGSAVVNDNSDSSSMVVDGETFRLFNGGGLSS